MSLAQLLNKKDKICKFVKEISCYSARAKKSVHSYVIWTFQEHSLSSTLTFCYEKKAIAKINYLDFFQLCVPVTTEIIVVG